MHRYRDRTTKDVVLIVTQCFWEYLHRCARDDFRSVHYFYSLTWMLEVALRVASSQQKRWDRSPLERGAHEPPVFDVRPRFVHPHFNTQWLGSSDSARALKEYHASCQTGFGIPDLSQKPLGGQEMLCFGDQTSKVAWGRSVNEPPQ